MTIISTTIYGQESLKENGIAITVNKRVWKAVLGCNLKNDLASWTYFSLSGSAGLLAVSSGMNLPWGAWKLGELQPEWGWWCARGLVKLLAGRRRSPLLFPFPSVLYSSVPPLAYLPVLRARTGVPWWSSNAWSLGGDTRSRGQNATGNAVEAPRAEPGPGKWEGTQSRPENHKPTICPSAPSRRLAPVPCRSHPAPEPGFSNTWTMNFQMSKLVLEKVEEPEIKLPTSAGSWEKQESSRKTCISALLTMPKPLTVWITINCGKFWKR